jgi:hypothetical protein
LENGRFFILIYSVVWLRFGLLYFHVVFKGKDTTQAVLVVFVSHAKRVFGEQDSLLFFWEGCTWMYY